MCEKTQAYVIRRFAELKERFTELGLELRFGCEFVSACTTDEQAREGMNVFENFATVNEMQAFLDGVHLVLAGKLPVKDSFFDRVKREEEKDTHSTDEEAKA